MDEGTYVYCITKAPVNESYGKSTLNDCESEVYTVPFRDIAVVAGRLPSGKCKVDTTRKNMLAHQRVMEELMYETTILPVKFGTVAMPSEDHDPDQLIKDKVLECRYEELVDLLGQMTGVIELGLKAIWTDMQEVYTEIALDNQEIARLRKKIAGMPESKSYQSKIALGRKVKDALEVKREKLADSMVKSLKDLCVDYSESNTYGDNMILNGAFLVQADRESDFDARIEQLKQDNDGKVVLRYVGPVPPCNFVDLVISWD